MEVLSEMLMLLYQLLLKANTSHYKLHADVWQEMQMVYQNI